MGFQSSFSTLLNFSRIATSRNGGEGSDFARQMEKQHGGNMAAALDAITRDQKNPDTMRKNIAHMIKHSADFRAYLGIRSLQFPAIPYLSRPAIEQSREAAHIWAQVATLKDITPARAERALKRLEDFFAARRFGPSVRCMSYLEAEALVCLGTYLDRMNPDLAGRAMTLIFNNHIYIPYEEQERRIADAMCGLEPSGLPLDPIALTRRLGVVMSESLKAVNAQRASRDAGRGRGRLNRVVMDGATTTPQASDLAEREPAGLTPSANAGSSAATAATNAFANDVMERLQEQYFDSEAVLNTHLSMLKEAIDRCLTAFHHHNPDHIDEAVRLLDDKFGGDLGPLDRSAQDKLYALSARIAEHLDMAPPYAA
jgi:hypothetical protein